MPKTLIIGGGGMIGQKLAFALSENYRNSIGIPSDLVLFDLGFPENGAPADTRVVGSVADTALLGRALEEKPDLIFHLASVVSGEAERDYEKGWSVNVSPFRAMLEQLRRLHLDSGGSYVPRVVFTSSVAVFGGPYPDKIGDEFLSAPLTSYGAQKAVCELMLSDASRKGFIDGIAIRLPTICVRPGKPNAAASGFFSNIIREPLNGQGAVLPVADTVRHWHASPRAAVGFLLHAAALDTDRLKGRPALNMPGVSCTVAEQIEALRAVAGNEAVARIAREPDPEIETIVSMWPQNFDPARARELGFRAESSFDEIVRIYIEDDLPGNLG